MPERHERGPLEPHETVEDRIAEQLMYDIPHALPSGSLIECARIMEGGRGVVYDRETDTRYLESDRQGVRFVFCGETYQVVVSRVKGRQARGDMTMDWKSEAGRELLRTAHPQGYLSGRGVHTVGNWDCIYAWESGAARFVYPRGDERYREIVVWPNGNVSAMDNKSAVEILAAGDLLPLPDQDDQATWACLLADLATTSHRFYQRGGLSWSYAPTSDFHTWLLRNGTGHVLRFDLGQRVVDPAEALVRARIQTRTAA